jgi:hypothetical protein
VFIQAAIWSMRWPARAWRTRASMRRPAKGVVAVFSASVARRSWSHRVWLVHRRAAFAFGALFQQVRHLLQGTQDVQLLSRLQQRVAVVVQCGVAGVEQAAGFDFGLAQHARGGVGFGAADGVAVSMRATPRAPGRSWA